MSEIEIYDADGVCRGYICGGLVYGRNGKLKGFLEDLPASTRIKTASNRPIERLGYDRGWIEKKDSFSDKDC